MGHCNHLNTEMYFLKVGFGLKKEEEGKQAACRIRVGNACLGCVCLGCVCLGCVCLGCVCLGCVCLGCHLL